MNHVEPSDARNAKTLQLTNAICVSNYNLDLHTLTQCGNIVLTVTNKLYARTAQTLYAPQTIARPALCAEIQLARKQQSGVTVQTPCQLYIKNSFQKLLRRLKNFCAPSVASLHVCVEMHSETDVAKQCLQRLNLACPRIRKNLTYAALVRR